MSAWISTLAFLVSVGSAGQTTRSSTSAPERITESEDWLSEPLDLPAEPDAASDGLLAAVETLARHIDFGGKLQSNVRYRPDNKSVGAWFNRFEQPPRFVRNEQILKLKMNASLDRFAAVFDVDLVWLGFSRDTHTLEDLSVRERVEPQRFEAHAAYLDATDILFDGLDLRIGHQIVAWGAADQFNPTNNLNADDLEDRLLFGVQQANLMARADYSIGDAFSVSGVLVPIFRPALLPASASVGLRQVDRLPMVDPGIRYRLHTEREAARINGFPTIVTDTEVVLPETNLENMQFGFRVATTVLNTDVALTYYQGFSDIPEAFENTVVQVEDPRCNPNDENDCISGQLETAVRLGYPRFRVVGLNVAGEIDLLGALSDVFEPIGFRLEVGVFFPERKRLRIFQGEVELFEGLPFPAGEYDYDLDGEPGGLAPTVVDSTPYAKWTLGLDYSIGEHIYINAMWVHGLVDEVGAGDWLSSDGVDVRQGGVGPLVDLEDALACSGRISQDRLGECADETFRSNIGDYLVLGLDFKWNGGNGLLRLFGVVDLTGYERSFFSIRGFRVRERYSPFSSDGFSVSLFPELNYNFGSGLELGVGGLMNLGKIYTKFGDPAAGGSLVWTRARLSF